MENMIYEVLKAVRKQYKTDKDTLVNCLIWLRDVNTSPPIRQEIDTEIISLNYCPICRKNLSLECYKGGARIYCSECGREYKTNGKYTAY